jgi:quercetin dioxygenase-like cupin family protein
VGAQHRTMAVVRLAAGGATVPLRHGSEAVWYVVSGTGSAEPDGGDPLPLETGAMVHVAPGAGYRLRAREHEALHLVGGPSPPDPEFAAGGRSGTAADARAEGVRLFHRDRPSKRVPMISSDARLVVWVGVGAETANMNYVRLEPGEENQPHSHAESEDTIMILSGRGTVDDITNGVTLEFEAGDMIHVPIGLEHRVKADRGSGVESVGGPCPPDRALIKVADPA